jgi:hypothetical protein
MHVVARIGRQRARGTSVGSLRKPGDGAPLRADKTKDQNKPNQVKAAQSAIQRYLPIRSFQQH